NSTLSGAGNDVVVLLSENGGHTWGCTGGAGGCTGGTTPPQYVDDTSSAGQGQALDQPGIYSNEFGPRDTWVSWRNDNRGHAWMRKIQFGPLPGNPISLGPLVSIPPEP